MSDEPGTGCEITTCGITINADKINVSIYLGGDEADKSFKFTVPKDLAMHLASTILKLAGPAGDSSTTSRDTRP